MASKKTLAFFTVALALLGLFNWKWHQILWGLRSPVVTLFHILYYEAAAETWRDTTWLGTEVQKNPMDLMVYQEIIYQTKPDWIIDAGTYRGGSALFFASICDLMEHGRVISIDINVLEGRPQHKRIQYLLGSSISSEVLGKIRSLIAPADKVMVSLDSDHSKEHVLKELKIYSHMVTVGNYLVVEDTDINGHPVLRNFGPGPMEALEDFLKENKDFVPDRSREKFLLTFNPKGYLRRVH